MSFSVYSAYEAYTEYSISVSFWLHSFRPEYFSEDKPRLSDILVANSGEATGVWMGEGARTPPLHASGVTPNYIQLSSSS